MTSKPQTGSKARHAPCLEEAVFLDLLRTSDVLSRRLAHVLKNEDLSSNQYNVLRILRGAPEGLGLAPSALDTRRDRGTVRDFGAVA